MKRLLLLIVAISAVALVAGGSSASAHSGDQSYVYLEIFDTAIAGRVEYPVDDLNDVLGLDLPDDESGIVDGMEADRSLIEAYTREHLAISPAEGGPAWTFEFGDVEAIETYRGSYAILQFELDERFRPSPPRTFNMFYDGIIEAKPERDAFLLIATDWDSGTFNNEGNEFLRFDSDTTEHLVDLDDTSWWKGFSGTIELGAEHIQIGTDHILFVLALVLPSVLVFTREPGDDAAEWHPTPRFGSSLWRVLKIVTMFTVAHSITLALGGLGYVELSPRFVETVIAISIAIAALHNIHPIWPNKEWVMAGAFGLFHGFGFAGLLSELGLDRSNRFPSLLGFNIGVEIGQAAIILMAFPILFIMRRTRLYKPFLYLGSAVLALVAFSWAFERIFDYDTNVSNVVDPVLKWPRSFALVVAGYVVATALWWVERARGKLLPVASTTRSDDPTEDEPERELVDA